MNENLSEEKLVEEIVETVPPEKREEFLEKVEETPAETPAVEETSEEEKLKLAKEVRDNLPIVGSLESLKNLFSLVIPNSATGTENHNPAKIHGNIQPKKNAAKIEKKARKQSKKSRRINRGK